MNLKKTAIAMSAVLFSLVAFAFEKYMIRVPDELNPKEGVKGVTTYFFAPAAVSVPLKDGNWIYIVNETPKQENEGGPAQIGVPKKVVELGVISRYLEAIKKFPSITVQIGESTFFAYRCRDMFPPQEGLFLNNCYQGLVVSMGSEYAISLFLPEGRELDDEVRGILKRITFVPCPGTAVESALKLYGPSSALPAASRLPIVKKMVERRGECCELIELLSTLTDDAATKSWCAARLKELNPGKYAPDKRRSVPYHDYKDKPQRDGIMEMIGAFKGAPKAVVSVPATKGASAPKVTSAQKPEVAAKSSRAVPAAQKTKTITLPGGATMEMIYCPPGTYTMGSPETENWRDESFEHQIKVTLTKGFWLGKYEVTQKQWKSVMGTNPSSDVGDDLPVGGLKWLDVCEFVRKVGNGARLPKEAEWEYACRAGTATAFPWGDSCNGNEANCNGEWPYGTKEKGPKLGKPAKGGFYPPNAWGFCDMNGNMSEWCSDFYKIWPKEEKELVDPEGISGGASKALRGGSFYDAAKFCRSASRKGFVPDSGQPHLGFRMAMDE